MPGRPYPKIVGHLRHLTIDARSPGRPPNRRAGTESPYKVTPTAIGRTSLKVALRRGSFSRVGPEPIEYTPSRPERRVPIVDTTRRWYRRPKQGDKKDRGIQQHEAPKGLYRDRRSGSARIADRGTQASVTAPRCATASCLSRLGGWDTVPGDISCATLARGGKGPLATAPQSGPPPTESGTRSTRLPYAPYRKRHPQPRQDECLGGCARLGGLSGIRAGERSPTSLGLGARQSGGA